MGQLKFDTLHKIIELRYLKSQIINDTDAQVQKIVSMSNKIRTLYFSGAIDTNGRKTTTTLKRRISRKRFLECEVEGDEIENDKVSTELSDSSTHRKKKKVKF